MNLRPRRCERASRASHANGASRGERCRGVRGAKPLDRLDCRHETHLLALSALVLLSRPRRASQHDRTRVCCPSRPSARRTWLRVRQDLGPPGFDVVGRPASHERTGLESHPAFSPDGTQIAFSAQYKATPTSTSSPQPAGGRRASPGIPAPISCRALRPMDVRCCSRRGARLSPAPTRNCSPCRSPGGWPRRCRFRTPMPRRSRPMADGSPTTRSGRASSSGRGTAAVPYRRSRSTPRAHTPPRKIAQPPSRLNAADPMWIGDTVVLPVRPEWRVQSVRVQHEDADLRQLTRHDDFPVLWARAGGGRILYERPATCTCSTLAPAQPALTLAVASDSA